MSNSDTEEISRFKIKHIEPVTNVEGTTNGPDNSHNASNNQNDDNRSCSQLQHKKLINTKTEKNRRQKYHQNLRHKIQRILPRQKFSQVSSFY